MINGNKTHAWKRKVPQHDKLGNCFAIFATYMGH
jgi:hypothetical protein